MNAVWKQPDGAGGYEKIYHETSAELVKYSDTSVAQVLDNLPLADTSDFMKSVLAAADANALRHILSINKDPLFDECGNEWTFNGAPYLTKDNAKFGKALQLNGSSAIGIYNFTIGGEDFAFAGWFYVAGTTRQNLFGGGTMNDGLVIDITDALNFHLWTATKGNKQSLQTVPCPQNQLFHLELDYINDSQTLLLFVDGQKIYETVESGFASARTFPSFTLSQNFATTSVKLTGSIDEFIIVKGKTLHTANFTPPTSPYEVDENTFALLHFDN